MALSCIDSEIKPNNGRKSQFLIHCAFDAPIRGGGTRRNIIVTFGTEKYGGATIMVEKFENMFNRFDPISACDRRTDRHLAMAYSALMQSIEQ